MQRSLPGMVPAAALADLADVTYRQLDYWLRRGVLGDQPAPGSGNYRQLPALWAPRVRLLGRISRAAQSQTRAGISQVLLGEIFARYHEGKLEIAPGVELRWEVEET